MAEEERTRRRGGSLSPLVDPSRRGDGHGETLSSDLGELLDEVLLLILRQPTRGPHDHEVGERSSPPLDVEGFGMQRLLEILDDRVPHG